MAFVFRTEKVLRSQNGQTPLPPGEMRTPYWCSRCAETPAVTVGPPFVGPPGAGPRLHCWRAVSRRTLRQAVVATSAVRARRLTGKLHAAAGRRGDSHGCGVVL